MERENKKRIPKKPLYTKEDLLWEATRRNVHYKEDYQQAVEKLGPEKIPPKLHGIITFPIRWGLTRLWDPCLSSAEIKQALQKESDESNLIRPYTPLLRDDDKSVLIHYAGPVFMGMKTLRYTERSDLDTGKLICIEETNVENRVLISINPFTNDEELIMEIKRAKSMALKANKLYRKSMPSMTKDPKFSNKQKYYNPSKVDTYIMHLEMYDDILERCTEIPERMIVADGALIPKSGFHKYMIPDAPRSQRGKLHRKVYENAESQVKFWRDAFNNAVRLIQTTPRIRFGPARTEEA